MNPLHKPNNTDSICRSETFENRPFISLIVPAYNEEAIIEKNLSILCEHMISLETEYRWELIVINDGSTDETGDLAEAFAGSRDNVYVLHHMFNFRLGQALRFAFKKCQGDYVVVMDLDLSYSPDHIGKMLDKIRETRAKIVIASPYMKGGKVSNVPWFRKTLSIWANRFLAFIITRDKFSDRLTTLTGMVRAYDKQFLSGLVLKAMDVDIHSEIIYKAMILRARIVEIPAHLNWNFAIDKHEKRISSMRILRSIMMNLTSGFALRPFMLFMIPGFTLFLLSIYPLIWAAIHTVSNYRKIILTSSSITFPISDAIADAFLQSPQSFIVGSFGLIVAIQLICLGFLSYQNKRNYEELFYLNSKIYKITSQLKKGDMSKSGSQITNEKNERRFRRSQIF
jgi:glycosyltransferase involved in cell wall biosynthesis